MLELKHILPEKKYLLAISGGIDSMVMAHVFLQKGISFGIAHVNFQLRGEESDEDEQFVRAWAQQHQVECYVKREDAAAFAAHKACSIQEAAREIRYAFFYEICDQNGFDGIATAHHQQDQMETVLFHFLRGTGINGLCGIPEKTEKLLRPILYWKKSAIRAYAKQEAVDFREDSSNLKTDYTRNKMRLEILPELQNMIPGVEDNLVNNTHRFKEIRLIFQKEIDRLRKKIMLPRGKDFYIPVRYLQKVEAVHTVLYELLHPYGFSYDQCVQVFRLTQSEGGHWVGNTTHRIIRYQDFLILTAMQSNESSWIQLQEESTDRIHHTLFNLSMKIKPYHQEPIAKDALLCIVDKKELAFPLLLRPWKPGDYMYPFGMKKKKKVARILIDAKIPLHKKEEVWVLESNQRIVWILGIKTDERFRVSSNTTEIVQFKLSLHD